MKYSKVIFDRLASVPAPSVVRPFEWRGFLADAASFRRAVEGVIVASSDKAEARDD